MKVNSALFAAALLCCVAAVAATDSDYGVYPMAAKQSDAGLTTSHHYFEAGGRNTSVFVAHVADASFVHVVPAKPNCQGLNKTCDLAVEHDCQYATNGGFFSIANSNCLGDIVSFGTVVNRQPNNGSFSMFGFTKGREFVVGYVNNTDFAKLPLEDAVNGEPWLVRDGVNLLKPDKGSEIAPRTVLGIDANNALIIAEADGVEKKDLGLTEYETAELMLKLGAVQALNLDGGGSSTSCLNGKLIDKPTCIDVAYICQRPVANIICVK